MFLTKSQHLTINSIHCKKNEMKGQFNNTDTVQLFDQLNSCDFFTSKTLFKFAEFRFGDFKALDKEL